MDRSTPKRRDFDWRPIETARHPFEIARVSACGWVFVRAGRKAGACARTHRRTHTLVGEVGCGEGGQWHAHTHAQAQTHTRARARTQTHTCVHGNSVLAEEGGGRPLHPARARRARASAFLAEEGGLPPGRRPSSAFLRGLPPRDAKAFLRLPARARRGAHSMIYILHII